MDITWVSDKIFNIDSSNTASQASAKKMADAARASRLGTRAARIIRIIRLIRLIRIIKLYKQYEKVDETKEDNKKSKPLVKNERGSNYQEGEDTPIHGEHSESEIQKKSNSAMMDEDVDSRQLNKMTVVDGKAISGDTDIEDLLQETNVGKKLSNKTNKIVIILILSIMMSIPLFSSDTFWSVKYQQEGSLIGAGIGFRKISANMIDDIGNTNINSYTDIKFIMPDILETSFNKIVNVYSEKRVKLLLLRLYFSSNNSNDTWELRPQFGNDDYVDTHRTMETNSFQSEYYPYEDAKAEGINYYQSTDIYAISGVWDNRKDEILNSILGILRTCFVCVILASASISMTSDAEDLVITPIETMINKVKRISKNPLEAAQIEEQDA